MPPTLPEPDAVDQIRLGSTGSGVAQPLSPPITPCQSLRAMVPPVLLLLGPRYEGPSCRLPSTQYGTWLSVVTWYIWAIGSCARDHVCPRVVEIDTPPSLPMIIRFAFVGSIHMSWLSPPGLARPPIVSSVRPPLSERAYDAVRKYVSSSLSGATSMCV